jgi:hypothetical protein
VPVPTGSITDFTANLKTKATVEEINAAYAAAAKKSLKGVLRYSDEPLVSSDIVTDPHSCVFDSGLTMSMGKMVKVAGWYDNEWGYSNRLVDSRCTPARRSAESPCPGAASHAGGSRRRRRRASSCAPTSTCRSSSTRTARRRSPTTSASVRRCRPSSG